MQEVRVFKLSKYCEFITTEYTVKDKLKANIPNYIIGVDLTRDSNYFYGLGKGSLKFELITEKDFDKYSMIVRLLSWNKNDGEERYNFRVLKSNDNEVVDFKEENEYLKCHIATIIP